MKKKRRSDDADFEGANVERKADEKAGPHFATGHSVARKASNYVLLAHYHHHQHWLRLIHARAARGRIFEA